MLKELTNHQLINLWVDYNNELFNSWDDFDRAWKVFSIKIEDHYLTLKLDDYSVNIRFYSQEFDYDVTKYTMQNILRMFCSAVHTKGTIDGKFEMRQKISSL